MTRTALTAASRKLMDARAEQAERREDYRIALKHAEEAGARDMTPGNREAYLRCLDWVSTCYTAYQDAGRETIAAHNSYDALGTPRADEI
jgi:hypothetical protein